MILLAFSKDTVHTGFIFYETYFFLGSFVVECMSFGSNTGRERSSDA